MGYGGYDAVCHFCQERLCVCDDLLARGYKVEESINNVKSDMVNHPPHYTSHPSGIECIQITEHMDFLVGNAVKYLWRADLKNGLEDLKKARWYIDRAIEKKEKEHG